MKPRIDWESLKTDFMRTQYTNLKEFAESHGLNYGTVRTRCSGWFGEKAKYQDRFSDCVLQSTFEADSMTATDRNLNHVQLWDRFLAIVAEALMKEEGSSVRNHDGTVKVGTLERLANIMEKAQRGQRLALGLDKEAKDAKGLLSEISAAISAAKSAYIEDEADEPESETT